MEDTDIEEEVFDATVCPECTKMTEHEILKRNNPVTQPYKSFMKVFCNR